jgi:hypothetical protein
MVEGSLSTYPYGLKIRDMADPKDNPTNAGQTTLNQGEGEVSFSRVGPLLSPERFKKKFLFGVPMKAALTGEEIDMEDLKDFLYDAISEVEMQCRIPVSPVTIVDKFDFEVSNDRMFSERQLTRHPVIKVTKLAALWPGRQEGQEYLFPTSWVSVQADSGLVQIVPNSADVQTNADAHFVTSMPYRAMVLGHATQWPNMWRIEYQAGFEHDKIPHAVNSLIGTIAALQLLSQMGPAIFPMNSVSIGLDGLSQGSGSPGPQWLAGRIQDLTQERDRLVQMIRAHYGTDMTMAVF